MNKYRDELSPSVMLCDEADKSAEQLRQLNPNVQQERLDDLEPFPMQNENEPLSYVFKPYVSPTFPTFMRDQFTIFRYPDSFARFYFDRKRRER